MAKFSRIPTATLLMAMLITGSLVLAGCLGTGHLRSEPDWTMQGEGAFEGDDAEDEDSPPDGP